ncbi:MAG: methyltransferase domain-containing protein [Candidatus Thermoplasmatota archaeon]
MVEQAPYDALATAYDATRRGVRFDMHDHLTWRAVTSSVPGPGGHVLDAGAGTGRFALRFLEAGCRVTLLDPSRRMLEEARRAVEAAGHASRATLVQAPIGSMPVATASIDFVFCEGDPLGYCADLLGAARDLLRVLRPGRPFYVSVDNRWVAALHQWSQGRVAEGMAAAEDGRGADPYGFPVHTFLPGELKGLFEAAGGEDVRVTGKGALAHLLPPATLDRLAAEHHDRWLRIEEAWSDDPGLAGAASHLVVTGRRRAGA